MVTRTTSISPTAIKLDSKLKSRLKKLGELKRRSMHWLMKDAIARYVAAEEEAERLKAETLQRWEQEAQQGKMVSHEKMVAWLDTWGTEKEGKRPRCDEN